MPAALVCFTLGPQRGPFVAQHISVLHTEQRIQSQPTFLVTITLQPGQCIASPFFTNAYGIECDQKHNGWTKKVFYQKQKQGNISREVLLVFISTVIPSEQHNNVQFHNQSPQMSIFSLFLAHSLPTTSNHHKN